MLSQSPPVRFSPSSPFHQQLKRAVDEYFRRTGQSRHGGWRLLLHAAILLAWLAASWSALMFADPGPVGVVVLTVSIGLAMAGIGFGVMHDANHGSLSSNPRVNRVLGLTMELLGGSSHLWRQKHNVLHHGFTNVAGTDADIEPGPLLRFAPWQPWRPYHRLQHVYVWALYAFFPIRWFFWDDYRELVTGRIGGRSFAPARGRTLAVALAGKVVFNLWAVVLPLALHPTWWLVPIWLLASFTLGTVLASVFQLAHCVGEARFHDLPDGAQVSTDWAEHQVTTTVDFGRENRLLGWYIGGLNFQVEHHLFPRISHIHYPAISRIVEATCHAHGVRYHAEPTLRSAVAANMRWLRAMGRPPVGTSAREAANEAAAGPALPAPGLSPPRAPETPRHSGTGRCGGVGPRRFAPGARAGARPPVD